MSKSISKRRAQRKKQKKARKAQQKQLKFKNFSRRAPLSPEKKKRKQERVKSAKERKETRKKQKKNGIERSEANIIKNALSSIFTPEVLDNFAKKTKFIQRTGGELTAFAYTWIMSFGFFGNGTISLIGLTSMLSSSFDIEITPQALSKRINTKQSVSFLSKIFKNLLRIQLLVKFRNNSHCSVFSKFTAINLQDSSQISLNPSLEKEYAGSGGAASKSSMKIDFIFDVLNLVVQQVKLIKGRMPDVCLAKNMLKHIKAKSLAIRDLGYFEIVTLKKIQERFGYYISRLSIGVNVYLNKTDDKKLNIVEFLKSKINEKETSINQTIYIGSEERFKTQLIVEKVPEKVSQQRQAHYKREYRKAPTQYYIEWCGYSIFITNIPAELFSAKMIIAVYKIRWQIELIFKNFKSNIEIDYLTGTNKHRIESLVYGRLITIATLFIIQNYAVYIAQEKEMSNLASEGKEVSGDKLTKWLKINSRLALAILEDSLLKILMLLEIEISKICKQKRSRQTTFEYIETQFKAEQLNEEQLELVM